MSFTLRFSGHETFALRYGWLNKSYNSLDYKEKNEENLVVDLGVGKNMVNSIKYWTEISGLQPLKVNDQKKRYISEALLHKAFEGKVFLSEPNLSGNLGVRAT